MLMNSYFSRIKFSSLIFVAKEFSKARKRFPYRLNAERSKLKSLVSVSLHYVFIVDV